VDDLTGFDWSCPSCFLVADDEERTVLTFHPISIASIQTRILLQRYMPTNIALDAIRARGSLKWGIPAMMLAILCLAVANVMTILIARGAPKWLHLLALLCI